MAFLIYGSALALLSLLALSSTTEPNCEELVKPLVLEGNYSSLMGRWIFTEAAAENWLFITELQKLKSSWIEFTPSAFRSTIVFSEGIKMEECQFFTVNVTAENNTFYMNTTEGNFQINFLSSCPNCLSMTISSQPKNKTAQALYLFKREPIASASDTDMYRKQVECLGLPKDLHFSYDGVTELCQEGTNQTTAKQN